MEERFDIKTLSNLARINLSVDEQVGISTDLKNVLNYVDTLNELNLDNIEPTSHVIELEDVYRPDIVEHSNMANKLFVNIAESKREDNFFKVPKIIED